MASTGYDVIPRGGYALMPTILHVEDDAPSRMLVKRILAVEGYEVIEAEDGFAGLEMAQQHLPDLILMDINIPGMDGYEITTKLKSLEETSHIPIVALTANVVEGDRERALVAGCDGYLSKPLDVDKFPAQLEAFLHGKRDEMDAGARLERLEEYSYRLVSRLEKTISELRRANQELRRVDKMKSDFVILASHELRTPLTLIYGYIHLLEMETRNLTDDSLARNMIRYIGEAAHRLTVVVDDIVNVSLIDADSLEIKTDPVNIAEAVNEALKELQQRADERGQQIEFKGLDELPSILGDAGYLRQAFSNLISNAMKYTPDDGYIEISGECLKNKVHIVVSDTGIGIDKEEQERIFDKFYVTGDTRHHSTSRTAYKGGGLGVGLSVARGIVEAHQGKIWVESEGYDEECCPGSQFHILLPLDHTKVIPGEMGLVPPYAAASRRSPPSAKIKDSRRSKPGV
jgi:signal transduction histidine kinase